MGAPHGIYTRTWAHWVQLLRSGSPAVSRLWILPPCPPSTSVHALLSVWQIAEEVAQFPGLRVGLAYGGGGGSERVQQVTTARGRFRDGAGRSSRRRLCLGKRHKDYQQMFGADHQTALWHSDWPNPSAHTFGPTCGALGMKLGGAAFEHPPPNPSYLWAHSDMPSLALMGPARVRGGWNGRVSKVGNM